MYPPFGFAFWDQIISSSSVVFTLTATLKLFLLSFSLLIRYFHEAMSLSRTVLL
jgi:hypothetical protein